MVASNVGVGSLPRQTPIGLSSPYETAARERSAGLSVISQVARELGRCRFVVALPYLLSLDLYEWMRPQALQDFMETYSSPPPIQGVVC